MSLDLPFDNTYADLPERFYTRLAPTPVRAPSLIALNRSLAEQLGLDAEVLATETGVAALAGNAVPGGADPLAQVYGGHQFGNWAGQLGDGRAILLGEVVTADGDRLDIQLKGSGPTPYSRMGDGRAWLGPVLQEYVVSEAMAALGVPTTRALAAVATGETVVREEGPLPGAVLTRVAASHIRVGTFQFFAAKQDIEGLQALVDYALERHYPSEEGALGLLNGVVARQADLVAQWMGLGFIHGVMNTDNMAISGETIDYGPCAFMDSYHPMRVFSSIDRQGRYAFGRQPDIAMWNLAQLGSALLPLIGSVDPAQEAVDRFAALFQAAWLKVMRAKIGLRTEVDGDAALIQRLLEIMGDNQADFSNTFRSLGTEAARDEFASRGDFDDWERDWRERLSTEDTTPEDQVESMQAVNPAVIPRLHLIEQAIQAGVAGDFAPFERLNRALTTPFTLAGSDIGLTRPPTADEVVPRTFCGT